MSRPKLVPDADGWTRNHFGGFLRYRKGKRRGREWIIDVYEDGVVRLFHNEKFVADFASVELAKTEVEKLS